jgi:hypothetical protein
MKKTKKYQKHTDKRKGPNFLRVYETLLKNVRPETVNTLRQIKKMSHVAKSHEFHRDVRAAD